jgi:hypothetical protein
LLLLIVCICYLPSASSAAAAQQLELLDLNENSIEALDCAWFDALPRLRTLMLENNGMEEIKGKFRLAQVRWSYADTYGNYSTILFSAFSTHSHLFF